MLVEELARTKRHPFFGRGARQVVLGQIGAIDRQVRVRADQHQLAAVALAAQSLGSGVAGGSGTHDDDPRRRSSGAGRQFRLRQAFAHPHPLALSNHLVAWDRVQRRRAQRRAGAQIEARMVPRAAHRPVDEQSLVERSRVVSAGGADREYFLAPARQQDGLAACVAKHHLAVGQFR